MSDTPDTPHEGPALDYWLDRLDSGEEPVRVMKEFFQAEQSRIKLPPPADPYSPLYRPRLVREANPDGYLASLWVAHVPTREWRVVHQHRQLVEDVAVFPRQEYAEQYALARWRTEHGLNDTMLIKPQIQHVWHAVGPSSEAVAWQTAMEQELAGQETNAEVVVQYRDTQATQRLAKTNQFVAPPDMQDFARSEWALVIDHAPIDAPDAMDGSAVDNQLQLALAERDELMLMRHPQREGWILWQQRTVTTRDGDQRDVIGAVVPVLFPSATMATDYAHHLGVSTIAPMTPEHLNSRGQMVVDDPEAWRAKKIPWTQWPLTAQALDRFDRVTRSRALLSRTWDLPKGPWNAGPVSSDLDAPTWIAWRVNPAVGFTSIEFARDEEPTGRITQFASPEAVQQAVPDARFFPIASPAAQSLWQRRPQPVPEPTDALPLGLVEIATDTLTVNDTHYQLATVTNTVHGQAVWSQHLLDNTAFTSRHQEPSDQPLMAHHDVLAAKLPDYIAHNVATYGRPLPPVQTPRVTDSNTPNAESPRPTFPPHTHAWMESLNKVEALVSEVSPGRFAALVNAHEPHSEWLTKPTDHLVERIVPNADSPHRGIPLGASVKLNPAAQGGHETWVAVDRSPQDIPVLVTWPTQEAAFRALNQHDYAPHEDTRSESVRRHDVLRAQTLLTATEPVSAKVASLSPNQYAVWMDVPPWRATGVTAHGWVIEPPDDAGHRRLSIWSTAEAAAHAIEERGVPVSPDVRSSYDVWRELFQSAPDLRPTGSNSPAVAPAVTMSP